ncbi:MAG TPA: hypothetical protein EYN41_07945 [Flavobacteriales bacterium]|nr:hypothetical protein [Flavobacteriales bacterium]
MKRTLKTLSFAALACILIGCPYTSSVPIDEPNVKVNKKLIGKWIKTSDLSAENPGFYEINEHDKFLYMITDNSYSSMDSTYSQDMYISHITDIEGTLFMNMQKDGTGDYYLHKVALEGKELTFIEVTENIDEKFNTSAELKAFIAKYMHLSFFYTKEEVQYTKQ